MSVDAIISAISTALASAILIIFQTLFNKKTSKNDKEEVKKEVYETLEKIGSSTNVIDMMKKNVAELREYYVISKQQANKAFSSAIFICFLGFIVFSSGIVISYFSEKSVIVFTTISGSIVEIVSGLFFWIFSRSQEQLNLYHERLGATERYLVSLQVIEQMSSDNKDKALTYLMESLLHKDSQKSST